MTNIETDVVNLDPYEVLLTFREEFGWLGQYDGRAEHPHRFYLPSAGPDCQVVLVFSPDGRIKSVERGPAFDPSTWTTFEKHFQELRTSGRRIGRAFSLSLKRVAGYWRGETSGVQILPPREDTPCAPVEAADHPFILEFPFQAAGTTWVTGFRWNRAHIGISRLLNVLLNTRVRAATQSSDHTWAYVDGEMKWVQTTFWANLGQHVIDDPSPITEERILEVEPDSYYANTGIDGKPLAVPADLDRCLSVYQALPPAESEMFDRSTFWLEMSSLQWSLSPSAAFASLVSAIEALTVRGETHSYVCPGCGKRTTHEVPGPTQRFRDFLEAYAPGESLHSERSQMYSLRSRILHGSGLLLFDQGKGFGFDPPRLTESDLHSALSRLTRRALRNWLRKH